MPTWLRLQVGQVCATLCVVSCTDCIVVKNNLTVLLCFTVFIADSFIFIRFTQNVNLNRKALLFCAFCFGLLWTHFHSPQLACHGWSEVEEVEGIGI